MMATDTGRATMLVWSISSMPRNHGGVRRKGEKWKDDHLWPNPTTWNQARHRLLSASSQPAVRPSCPQVLQTLAAFPLECIPGWRALSCRSPNVLHGFWWARWPPGRLGLFWTWSDARISWLPPEEVISPLSSHLLAEWGPGSPVGHDHFPHPLWDEVLSRVSSRVFQAWTASSLSASGLPQPGWRLWGVAPPQTDLACLLLPHGWPWGDLCDPFLGAQRKKSSDSGSCPHIGLPSPEARAQAAEVRGDTCYQVPETEIRFADGWA